MTRHVIELLEENGEYVGAEALTPARAWVLYGGPDAAPVTTDGPLPDQDPAAVLGRAVAVGHVLGAAAGLRETDRLRARAAGVSYSWACDRRPARSRPGARSASC
jgi:hypothetical protein